MGLKVKWLAVALLAPAQLLLTLPLTERSRLSAQRGKECKMCPAGQYRKSREGCAPCPAGTYTAGWNCEDRCHRCFGDCRPEFNQRVLANCSGTSNLKCACQEGFRCTALVAFTDNCKNCVATATGSISGTSTAMTTTTAAPDEDEQTPSSSSSSSGVSSLSARLCSFPKCDDESRNSSHADKEVSPGPGLLAVTVPMVVVVTAVLAVLLCICRSGEETCLKRAVMKLRNKDGPNAAGKAKEANQHLPIDPLGAVHVHNAGTVIISWLSQFTGQVGPVTEAGRATQEEDDNEGTERGDRISLGVPLSEEERSDEMVFLPSQEEGKDCHVSKEEAEA